MSDIAFVVGAIVAAIALLAILGGIITAAIVRLLVKGSPPEEILRRRYAKGELSREEYEQMLRVLLQGIAAGEQATRVAARTARTDALIGKAQLGFWSGIVTAVCAIGFVVTNHIWPSPAWHGMAAYIASFDSSQMIWLIPCFILAPSWVVLMACVHADAPMERKLLTQIGLAFATLYAALAAMNYFIQLIAVRPSILSGEAQGLAFLAMPNPHSLFLALEGLGYAFQQIGMLFTAFVFTGGVLQRSIRWSLLGAGFGCWALAGVLIALIPALGSLGLITVGTDLWALLTALSGILLALLFRRQAPTVM